MGRWPGLYTAITNWEPKEYPVEKYLETKPSAKWLRLTGGVVDLTGVTYSSLLGVGAISEVYAPVKPSGSSSDHQVHILLATKDPALLQTAEKLRALNTEKDLLRFIQEHEKEVIIPKRVEGLIRFGIELKDRDERKLRTLNPNLAQDFVVLAEGEQPERLLSAFLFLCGAALAVWIFRRIFGARSPPVIPQPPVIPPPAGGPPPLLSAR